MKTLLFSLLIFMNADSAPEYVTSFHAIETSQEEKDYLSKYSSRQDPGVKAYVLTLRIKQLSTLVNPYSKWKGFKKHTASMNALAKANPDNIHVRYCRLMVQEEAPSFLGYNDFLESDRTYLRKKLATKDDTDYMDSFIRSNTSL